jgi:hypothetical protein
MSDQQLYERFRRGLSITPAERARLVAQGLDMWDWPVDGASTFARVVAELGPGFRAQALDQQGARQSSAASLYEGLRGAARMYEDGGAPRVLRESQAHAGWRSTLRETGELFAELDGGGGYSLKDLLARLAYLNRAQLSPAQVLVRRTFSIPREPAFWIAEYYRSPWSGAPAVGELETRFVVALDALKILLT